MMSLLKRQNSRIKASVAACAVFACAGVLWLNSSGNKDQTAALIAVSETDSNTKRSYVSSSGYYSVNESSGHQGNVSGESGEISEETGFVSESAESYSGSGGIQSSGEYKSESSTAESHVIHGSELSTGGGTSDVSEEIGNQLRDLVEFYESLEETTEDNESISAEEGFEDIYIMIEEHFENPVDIFDEFSFALPYYSTNLATVLSVMLLRSGERSVHEKLIRIL